jgi:hypothetical protein
MGIDGACRSVWTLGHGLLHDLAVDHRPKMLEGCGGRKGQGTVGGLLPGTVPQTMVIVRPPSAFQMSVSISSTRIRSVGPLPVPSRRRVSY